MRESAFERRLIRRIESMFPGCVILKNNANLIQGIPDRLILWQKHWAMLEVKRSANEPFQPNQEYYLDMFHEMSFAGCIYPENEEEVLSALQSAFTTPRQTRVSQR